MVGRIHDRLASRYGLNNVFLDEADVPSGADFPELLRQKIIAADLVLAVIGPQWLELMRARSAGKRDFVRVAIETALQTGKRIIPLLISDAAMPELEALPGSISGLANLNARRIDPGREFNAQIEALISDVEGRSRRSMLKWGAAAAAMATSAAASGLYWRKLKSATDTAKISILIIYGENVPYEREIVRGFTRRLESGLKDRDISLVAYPDVVPKFERTYASPNSEAGRKTWEDVTDDIRRAYAKGSIDYFVCLGTFASLAVKQSNLIYELGAKGLIYLGVTDPAKAGLVQQYKMAGVRYGTGGLDYGRKVIELFAPDQKLVFIYQHNEENIQDRFIAADLERLNQEFAAKQPEWRMPRFEIRPVDGLIDIADLKLADPTKPTESDIYFAWYGLDNILSLENKSSLHNPNLWIVPSTFSEKILNLAGVVVTVDDTLVGSLGADIVLKHVDEPKLDLAAEPIGSPGFRVWIKRDTLQVKGIRLAESAYNRQLDTSFTYR